MPPLGLLYLSSVLCVLSIFFFYERYQSSLDRQIITTLLVRPPARPHARRSAAADSAAACYCNRRHDVGGARRRRTRLRSEAAEGERTSRARACVRLQVPSGYLFLVELPRPSLLGAHLCLATNFFVIGFTLRACLGAPLA